MTPRQPDLIDRPSRRSLTRAQLAVAAERVQQMKVLAANASSVVVRQQMHEQLLRVSDQVVSHAAPAPIAAANTAMLKAFSAHAWGEFAQACEGFTAAAAAGSRDG